VQGVRNSAPDEGSWTYVVLWAHAVIALRKSLGASAMMSLWTGVLKAHTGVRWVKIPKLLTLTPEYYVQTRSTGH
jgi:hypothetical protein